MIAALFLATSAVYVPHADDILNRVADAALRCLPISYSGTRTYAIRNLRFNREARVVVRMTYNPNEGKQFTVVERSGSEILVSIVQRLIDAETKTSRPAVAANTGITAANYLATLRGSASLAGRECWILELKPRAKNKFLFSGLAWIDKRSGAIVQLDGKAAASVSVWVGTPHIIENRAEVDGLWLPTHTASRSTTFLAGDSELVIDYTGYQVQR